MENRNNNNIDSKTLPTNNTETNEVNTNAEKIEIDNNILTNHTHYSNTEVIPIILG